MSFEPASPISIITCSNCQGSGCQTCQNHGVYALQENQPIVFNLPDFIDFKARKQLKTMLLIKRGFLLAFTLIIIILAWALIK